MVCGGSDCLLTVHAHSSSGVFVDQCIHSKGKGKVHRIAGHEGTEGE